MKSGEAKQGVKPVLRPAMPLHKKLDGLNLFEAETEESTDIQPIAGRKPSGEINKTAGGLLNLLLKKAVIHARTATTTVAKQTKIDTPAQKSGEEAQT